MLLCKKLDPNAILPTIGNPGEDLGYDLYALEPVRLSQNSHCVHKVRTGIAARFIDANNTPNSVNYGLLFRDRSSMASRGITLSGGVVDAGYTGELLVLLTNHSEIPVFIQAGDKIAQAIPTPVLANTAQWVDELPNSNRASDGFGSTGR